MQMLGAAAFLLANAISAPLEPGHNIHLDFGPTSETEATVHLRRGQSAEIVVVQRGIDVVVRLRSPDGQLLDEVDSPNGRNGDEPVSIYARIEGNYRIAVRPISPSEPAGAIDIQVRAIRTAGQTAEIRRQRAELRHAAAGWLRRNDAPLPPLVELARIGGLEPFDSLAASAKLIGLGEATHGSREFGDVRLALVERLIQRHGYRLVAVEDSVSRWRALEPYVSGLSATPATSPEWGWIGRRSRRQLLEWVRAWNLRHADDRVRIVGVDPQDNGLAREFLPPLLERAYGESFGKAWQQHAAELAAADEQTAVFGNSAVAAATRAFLVELLARLESDGPLLRSRLGNANYEQALDYTRELAAFADFNGSGGALSKSRDSYMALGLLRALASSNAKAIYWGHNSHISVAGTSSTGALLRTALGCGYRAVATTFGQGSFLAQIPNDPADRLQVTTVGPAQEESVEAALAEVRSGAHIASWSCGVGADKGTTWLRELHPMRWVGGLYAPDSALSASFRPYRLTEAFDAIIFFPRVSAEAKPGDRPLIPARTRQE